MSDEIELILEAADYSWFDPDELGRKPRCGPFIDGRCEKCGRLDPLDFIEEFGGDE